MKVNPNYFIYSNNTCHYNYINFNGKIIDSHAHIGQHNNKNYTKEDLDVFVKSNLTNGDTVEKIIVSDIDVLHGTKDEYSGNSATLALLANDSHYAVIASCNPKEGDLKNIQKLYKNNKGKFVGLKFHPEIQQLEITDTRYKPYFEFAEKNNLPCLFHSAVNVDNTGKLKPEINKFSDPEIIYEAAKKYKKTPFVMAHLGAGWNEAHDKAIDVLLKAVKNGDANLYADISWTDIDQGNKDHIIKAIKELKGIGKSDWKYGDQSFRLMFGTDAPLERFKPSEHADAIDKYSKFVEEIKTAIRQDNDLKKDSENIIEDLFYNNAKKLYLNKQEKTASVKKVVFTGLLVGGLAVLCTAAYSILKNTNKNATDK